MADERQRLVVVGGGVSGLAAAWAATDPRTDDAEQRPPQPPSVLLLEREREVGGKARSLESDGGWLVEGGPTACFGEEPILERLIERAGLQDERVEADQAAARRFLVRGGSMREVHAHPLRFARSGLLSAGGMLRMAAEPFVPRRRSTDEESVWSFARRRIGAQGADRLIAPMVLGIFAGDARRLSLEAAFPRLAVLEREHGSLFRGMLAKRKERRAGGPAGRGGTLTSFAGGLQTLPRRLAARGAFDVRTGAEVESVVRAPADGRGGAGGWRVAVRGDAEPVPAEAVILAGEPWASARLLRQAAPRLAELLEGIYCPSLAVVGIGYGPEGLQSVPRGFGVLIPRGEGYRILGSLWDTHLFPGRSPEGSLLVRAMVGGALDPEGADLPDDELLATVRDDLRRLLGIRSAPTFERVVRWPRAIPQYELGHLARVRAIEAELEQLPGLFLAGNALHGVAFDKAAASGDRCGRRALAALGALARARRPGNPRPSTTGPAAAGEGSRPSACAAPGPRSAQERPR